MAKWNKENREREKWKGIGKYTKLRGAFKVHQIPDEMMFDVHQDQFPVSIANHQFLSLARSRFRPFFRAVAVTLSWFWSVFDRPFILRVFFFKKQSHSEWVWWRIEWHLYWQRWINTAIQCNHNINLTARKQWAKLGETKLCFVIIMDSREEQTITTGYLC